MPWTTHSVVRKRYDSRANDTRTSHDNTFFYSHHITSLATQNPQENSISSQRRFTSRRLPVFACPECVRAQVQLARSTRVDESVRLLRGFVCQPCVPTRASPHRNTQLFPPLISTVFALAFHPLRAAQETTSSRPEVKLDIWGQFRRKSACSGKDDTSFIMINESICYNSTTCVYMQSGTFWQSLGLNPSIGPI